MPCSRVLGQYCGSRSIAVCVRHQDEGTPPPLHGMITVNRGIRRTAGVLRVYLGRFPLFMIPVGFNFARVTATLFCLLFVTLKLLL